MAKRRRKTKPGGATSRDAEAPMVLQPVLPPLPDEIAEDIFLRLPIKSLAASLCVSPSWNGLISSPTFARRHHAAAASLATAAPHFVSVPVDTNWHHRHSIATPKDTIPRSSFCEGCPRVFSGAGKACRGAVLVGRPCEGEFFLCSPATGGALRLPPRRPPWQLHSAGLGHDPAGQGTHKAVLLERTSGHPPPRWWVPRLQCVVATVGGAGQWRWRAPRGRKTPIICDGAVVSARMDPVFADGRLHWMLMPRAANNGGAQQGGAGHNGVLAFALDSESFRRLPLPPSFGNGDQAFPERATLAEIDGNLGLLRDLRRQQNAIALFEVWMLRDDNKSTPSWSMDRRIDLTPHIGKELTRSWHDVFVVVCYTGGSDDSGRKILLASTEQRAYMYEPDTGELRTVAKRDGSAWLKHLRLVLYQESLVQVGGMEYGNKDIEFTFGDEKALGLTGLRY